MSAAAEPQKTLAPRDPVIVTKEFEQHVARQKFLDRYVQKHETLDLQLADSQSAAATIREKLHAALEVVADESDGDCDSEVVQPIMSALHTLKYLDEELLVLLAYYDLLGGDKKVREIADAAVARKRARKEAL